MPQVYIGELEDVDLYFIWNTIGAYYQRGNLPRLISEISPPVWRSSAEALGALVSRIESGVFSGEQVERGCWVAIVTVPEIIRFINELYSRQGSDNPASRRKNTGGGMDKIVVLPRRLDPGKNYALVGRRR